MEQKIEKLMKALEKNNMQPFYAETKEEAAELLFSLIPEGATVTHGGSESLKECGVRDRLKDGNFTYLDRSAPGLTKEEAAKVYEKSFAADVYLTSANAVTMDGVLYNVDGNSNRVAAITFGPKSVITLVGVNKIVDTLDEAVERVRAIAAPKNCKRLNLDTYCANVGHCICRNGEPMGEGCSSPSRICCSFVVTGQQRQPGRIKVIIVNEDLGY